MPDSATAHCWSEPEDPGIPITHGSWHTVRIEVNTVENESTFLIDGKEIHVVRYNQPIQNSLIFLSVTAHATNDRPEDAIAVKGYVDDVRIGPLK